VFFTENGIIPVVLRGDEHLDLRPIVSDITPEAIASGALAAVDATGLSPVRGPFTHLAPINGVRQIAATKFNYKKRIEEFKMKPLTEPELFVKAVTALTGPNDPISRGPNAGTELDWEVELAIVVGRKAQDITAAEVGNYIIGYVCLNEPRTRNEHKHRND
jgi:2-keto-4-pentenoate hydratase/2-oxohepta-3-ene-1,7-dioic acid hydratase in catechol pathway